MLSSASPQASRRRNVVSGIGPQQGAAFVFVRGLRVVAIGVIIGLCIGVVIGRDGGDLARSRARRVDFPQAELHGLVSSTGAVTAARPGLLAQIMKTPSKAM
jgi:hypothetical protein